MPRVWVRAAGMASIVLAGAAIWAAPAGASRAANSGERRGLTQAVHASRVGGLGNIPQSHYRVTGQRISTVSSSWAIAKVLADLFRTKQPCSPGQGIG